MVPDTILPFGNLTVSSGTITNPFKYTGREFDSETGLYYYRARHYDATEGRFVSEDPIGFHGDVNFYAYVKANPTTYKDPLGLLWVWCQNTGEVYHQDNTTHSRSYLGTGYSGKDYGKNSQGMEYAENLGPIVRGDYTIGPQQDIVIFVHGRRVVLRGAMRLTPSPATNRIIHEYGRTGGFIIYGDSIQHPGNASEGCPVLGREFRNQIASSADNQLSVELCGLTD